MKRFAALLIASHIIAYGAALASAPAPLEDLDVGSAYSFVIAWNGIPVGNIETRVEELTSIQGRSAYKTALTVKTNKWASVFYPVEDVYVTYIDRETSASLRHEVQRSEGRYRKRAVIDYIYGRFLANYYYAKSGTEKSITVKGDIHDPLSAAYYFIRRDLAPGQELELNIDLNEKRYRLFAKIEKGRRMKIARLGAFDTIIVRPYADRDGLPYPRGNGYAYLSAGPDKLPLFAVVNVFIWGRFTAILCPPAPHRK